MKNIVKIDESTRKLRVLYSRNNDEYNRLYSACRKGLSQKTIERLDGQLECYADVSAWHPVWLLRYYLINNNNNARYGHEGRHVPSQIRKNPQMLGDLSRKKPRQVAAIIAALPDTIAGFDGFTKFLFANSSALPKYPNAIIPYLKKRGYAFPVFGTWESHSKLPLTIRLFPEKTRKKEIRIKMEERILA